MVIVDLSQDPERPSSLMGGASQRALGACSISPAFQSHKEEQLVRLSLDECPARSGAPSSLGLRGAWGDPANHAARPKHTACHILQCSNRMQQGFAL